MIKPPVAILLLFAVSANCSCPDGWTVFNGVKCYRFFSYQLSRDDAVDHCKQSNSTLFSIDSPEEEDFIIKMGNLFEHKLTWSTIKKDGYVLRNAHHTIFCNYYGTETEPICSIYEIESSDIIQCNAYCSMEATFICEKRIVQPISPTARQTKPSTAKPTETPRQSMPTTAVPIVRSTELSSVAYERTSTQSPSAGITSSLTFIFVALNLLSIILVS
ncbi:hypothetical protein HDE_06538 [Halotydeus destructor]|nr:hypothetical protein HDE_06538 [Halotydeus destructor]